MLELLATIIVLAILWNMVESFFTGSWTAVAKRVGVLLVIVYYLWRLIWQ